MSPTCALVSREPQDGTPAVAARAGPDPGGRAGAADVDQHLHGGARLRAAGQLVADDGRGGEPGRGDQLGHVPAGHRLRRADEQRGVRRRQHGHLRPAGVRALGQVAHGLLRRVLVRGRDHPAEDGCDRGGVRVLPHDHERVHGVPDDVVRGRDVQPTGRQQRDEPGVLGVIRVTMMGE